MADKPQTESANELTPEEARMVIEAIEEVEQAEAQDASED